jgi:hypothetical protein
MAREIQTGVQLANMALLLMQAAPIESFDEDTFTAQKMRLFYDVILRRCLDAYPWNFARKQSILTELPKSPLPQWSHAYHLTPDFVQLLELRCGLPSEPNRLSRLAVTDYEITDGNTLCTNAESPLTIRYVYGPPVEKYPHYFIEYFVSSLVEEMSPLFGYNLRGQQNYTGRILGSHGKLSDAILQERMQHPDSENRRPSSLQIAREW